jgi:hypothetical protein
VQLGGTRVLGALSEPDEMTTFPSGPLDITALPFSLKAIARFIPA